jgi:hypothetical protein
VYYLPDQHVPLFRWPAHVHTSCPHVMYVINIANADHQFLGRLLCREFVLQPLCLRFLCVSMGSDVIRRITLFEMDRAQNGEHPVMK